jgi:CheY-like chemotaxis protein
MSHPTLKTDSSVNKELASFVCAIAKDPLSWVDWKCIDIAIEDTHNSHDNTVSLLCAQSLIQTYLAGKNIHSFVCAPHSLYVLCKNIDDDVFEEIEQYVATMVRVENNQTIYFQVYALDKDIDAFLTKILEQGDAGPLSLSPVTKPRLHTLAVNKNTKALLVEDDPVTRWMVRNTLKEECHLVTASTAGAACTIFSSFKPDIVFLDIGLPDKNGLEVLSWILRNDPEARVIMFSSQDTLDSMATALDAGAKGFVAKPFSRDILVGYVRQTLCH